MPTPVAKLAVPFLFFVSVAAFAQPLVRSDVPERELARIDQVDANASAQLRDIELPGRGRFTLSVQPFELYAPGAQIVTVHAGGRVTSQAPRSARFFRGQVAGHPGSMVFLSRDVQVRGLILLGDEKFVLGPTDDKGLEAGPAHRRVTDDTYEIRAIRDDLQEPFDSRGWRCDVEGTIVDRDPSLKRIAPSATSGNATYGMRIAIETDFELTEILGSTTAVETYIGNLVGAASVIYQRDLKTTLQIGTVYTYATSADPWTTADTFDALMQLGDYWHANRAGIGRSSVVMLSGKPSGGGIAWVGTTCENDFSYGGHWGGGYAYCGDLNGAFSTTNPALYWDLLEFTHELGHNAGSDHTHCIAVNPATYGRSWVDLCYGSEGAGCYSGATSVPAEKGTIMSYCHIVAPNYSSNVKLIFGETAKASEVVPPIMITQMNNTTASATFTSMPSSVVAGSTGNTASVAAASGVSYQWSITNGVITSGANSRIVTFSAPGAGPITLSATVTLPSGCAATNTATITVTGNANFHVATTGVFRPSNGQLYLKNSNTTGFADMIFDYGIPGDYPVVGDWDGDGDVTLGIYRNGNFYLKNSNTTGFADMIFQFGLPGDQPVAGDWNGDGVDTIGVYRNGTFYLRNSNTAGPVEATFELGIPGDIGFAGDWNGDGTVTTGVFRPSNGQLYLKNTNTTGFADIILDYGIPGDHPVAGDWNGDGTDSIGVYRQGRFYLRNSNTTGFADMLFELGIPGDMPIAGDWDGLP